MIKVFMKSNTNITIVDNCFAELVAVGTALAVASTAQVGTTWAVASTTLAVANTASAECCRGRWPEIGSESG